ncbi:NAD-dependent epimerase/dehydratase family protein [Liquorilactobacillus nagelii]|uniref:NAD-dependent epimerase/dehydratase family protein n=1 Tax=Liquorilactobacillus nagelii TaxID=82688 RepID=UPI0006EF6F49|nr:NAD(P)-dependent oxidoreductase [Liquorilactobacillus nagelii]KRL41817.1 hypothetical protein FD45_GL000669 [Liquorilactobacillus nagelii DSM 13675]QYH55293.1 NAD(P)-dependent oxidoreductase [Liquorilactobacillus nagelii DSM 13675]
MKKVLITGASGAMGQECLKQMVVDLASYELTIFCLDNQKDRAAVAPYEKNTQINIIYGDLLDYQLVKRILKGIDLVIHIAAFVSPAADYYPKKAMQVNYGSMRNIIWALRELKQDQATKVVSIGTVAETGDRMPPLHWGRIGDPIKPSMFDYYAVSKVAAERLLIESGLKYWVSLRQTGIMGPNMAKIHDAIMFHNCLNNVLEYVSDRDSGRLISHLCRFETQDSLPKMFWNHVYNIGGGPGCRVSTLEMYRVLYSRLGIKNLSTMIDPRMYATRNFHGQYYLDSDKLENYLHFQHDTMEYFYQAFIVEMGSKATAAKILTKIPGGEKLLGIISKKQFQKLARSQHGTVHFIEDHVDDHIAAFWGSQSAWKKIPKRIQNFKEFKDWNQVIKIDHGYDESKPVENLNLTDLQQAAMFRGGECLSNQSKQGDWTEKLIFRCAFGHEFKASPKLVLEGGHWCPVCERTSWNYSKRAQVDPFFAQVWQPLHADSEVREYPKVVSELDV